MYRVHPLPESMIDFVFDFGALTPDNERLYIKAMLRRQLPHTDEKKSGPADRKEGKAGGAERRKAPAKRPTTPPDDEDEPDVDLDDMTPEEREEYLRERAQRERARRPVQRFYSRREAEEVIRMAFEEQAIRRKQAVRVSVCA